MLTKTERIKRRITEHLKAARELADRVAASGREFTAEEAEFCQDHLDEARRLRPKLEQAKREDTDAQVMAAIKDLGDHVGMPPGAAGAGTSMGGTVTAPRSGNRRLKALGGSTWGETVVRTAASDGFGQFKALMPSGAVPVSVPLSTEPVREGVPVLALRQLIPAEPDSVGYWAYMRQTLRQSSAGVVPKGERKPTSLFELSREDGRSVTIAHLSEPLNRADIADAALLEQFVDQELRLGIEQELEDQMINGDGVGDNFEGLNAVSGTQSQAWDTDLMQTTRAAITKLEVISVNATGWLFHPSDWERVELSANATGYQLTQAGASVPVERASRRLWGIPVVTSTSATAGTGWLCDFDNTVLKVREDTQVSWSEAMFRPDAFGAGDGASDWERNLIAARCEGRFGWAVKRPAGCVKITLTGV